ncbi:hypothetical protein SteCoe_13621 [Stentor coeruleus]|uniref:Uncharacterized protein n=1 Tax=Stentor coeruleus TaxID=5963 RepID=A0A1R2C818_9CILI|nr:hypothetical protein SteCoe_13621 [Stentor coeruleus]
MEGTYRKQRGIYSEVLAPEETAELQPSAATGPQSKVTTHPMQKLPRVRGISKRKESQINDGSSVGEPSSGIYSKKRIGVADVDPKVFEPYAPIPGRTPRKVVIDRQKKLFASLRIEDLLKEQGIEYTKPIEAWLNLEPFDDSDFNVRNPEEWIQLGMSDGKFEHIPGLSLQQSPNDSEMYYWRPVLISVYDGEKKVFKGVWDEPSKKDVEVPKINLLFLAEDPYVFAKRVAEAHRQRQVAENMIKYNFFIDNMPTEEIHTLDSDQKIRLVTKATNVKYMNKSINPENSPLVYEVCLDFARTMNKIIFEKHSNDRELIDLVKKSSPHSTEVPEYGMVQIPRHEFPEQFSNFCFNSLYIKEEVILSLDKIKEQCILAAEKEIFNTNFIKTMRLEEFRQIESGAISQVALYLTSWKDHIQGIIQNSFQGVGKGWFNLHETAKETYEFGKLKKYLTMVKIMMQDTLFTMTHRSLHKFVEMIGRYIPSIVKISTPKEVSNEFELTSEQLLIDPEHAKNNPPIPLIAIDILKGGKMFIYSTEPQQVIEKTKQVFEEGLNKIKDIPTMEEVVMEHLFKKQGGKTPLKVPVIPVEQPIAPKEDEKKGGKLPDENTWVWDLRERIVAMMKGAIQPLYEYIKVYDQYEDLMMLNAESFLKQFNEDEGEEVTVDQLKDEITKHQEMEKKILEEIPETIRVSCFEVHCKEVRNTLAGKHVSFVKHLIEMIAQKARDATVKMLEEFRKMHREISKPPKDIEELTEIKDYISRVPVEIEKMKQEIEQNMSTFGILEKFQYRFTNDDMNKKWDLFGYPKKTAELNSMKNEELDKLKVGFQEAMSHDQEEFKEAIEDLENIVKTFVGYTDINTYKETAEMVERVNKRLEECTNMAKTFNHREYLFDYSQVHQCAKEFKPYSDLWTTIANWYAKHNHWMNGEWETVSGREIEDTVESSSKTITQVLRHLRNREINSVLPVAEKIKADVDYFKQYVKLAVALRKPGMRDRHWDQITNKVGFEVRPHEGFTLTTVINMGLKKWEDFCDEVGERAYKEYQIETKLNEMEAAWEKIDFEVLPAKNTDTFILGGLDKIQNLLDEHTVISQAMQFSAFKKPFEDRIEDWVSTLMRVLDILDQWSKCQVNWMYLQPIFDSKDIMKQLPNESKKFRSVDGTWRHTMSQVKANPNVIKTCKNEGRLEALREANRNLEAVQKELNNYLETKRAAFARFYFLSNDDLLSILSETKDPSRVQPHLRKVFENMNSLEFHDDLTIHSMYSCEMEQVAFVRPLNPKDKNVEFWMSDLEEMMKESVRHVLKNSIEDYKVKIRNDWVLLHPGQCVLNGSQVHWTKEVEEAILKGLQGVKEYHMFLDTMLMETVKLVRGNITTQQSITLGALIVIDVHAKDVVHRLIENKVTTIDDFDWIAQLRYYWEDEDCYVKCVQTRFPYGYEYLGNTPRLVITPLTDKCYMTLMGALNLGLGGAPAGPAGTGKTESVKDLSKALAKQVVVFNCSEDMDYIMVAKFFKGLASSGAWACFDEFNRIQIEVLSVIAQQLQTLLEKKRKGEIEFDFEGSTIKMQSTFSVFITMNPGYAGRTELPDNLKALFRPVAMMVPDYAMIGEIMLYSFGFTKARDLAKKMVDTFKLSSEQLSSQDHYDYGMRAVRSVINAAGLIKRAEPDLDEQQLLLRALRDVNVPKFLKDDLPLFEYIIIDLFPGVEKPNINRKPLDQSIIETCEKLNLQPEQSFIDKIYQLYDTTKVRHGLMIVGPTGGGKTSNYEVLSKAISALKHLDAFDDVFVHCLNPKSITMGQLYGKFDELTHEWTDGILADLIRKCVRDQHNPPFSNKHWVMFDGPVDALWIENMNTVLDDNKKLCLNSGEIIPLSAHMTMMFEVEDLAVASPATVSRCGMVYMEPISLGLPPLVVSWLKTLPPKVQEHEGIVKKLSSYFEIYAYNLIKFLRKNLIEPVTSQDNNLCQSICRIINCFLVKYNDSELKVVSPEEVEELEEMIENIFIYAVIWCIGVTTNSDGRKKFDKALRDILNTRSLKPEFPVAGSVYDWSFDDINKAYIPWTDTIAPYEVDSHLQFNEIVVPTMDSIRTKFLYKLLLTNRYHVLSPGPTGTGKSVNSSSLLTTEMPENYTSIFLTFSAQTSANQTQDLLDSKFQRRSNKIYGPPPGKYSVIFVDDLNMPKKEKYGAQPPLELLRQWMDHRGWYDRKEKIKKDIVDIVYLSAMGPPGGGRSVITNRLVRHFNLITYTILEETDITMIYTKILTAVLRTYQEPVRNSVSQIVLASISLYNFVEKTLLPTPDRSHYTFNLRDMAHVFEGVCSSDPKVLMDYLTIVRLWCHENLRVFGDRLINNDDTTLLMSALKERVKEIFKLDPKEVFARERLIFGNFLNPNLPEDQRVYEEVKDTNELMHIVMEYLEGYNDRYTKKQMKLVMFLDACCHVAKICRIIRQPMGNALLLGVGGSGRQSISKLASFILECELKQIEITKSYNMAQWRDDLKNALKFAGMKNERVIFLLVDTQIIDEQMLEDVNNVLNSGDVPNLYKQDDMEDITSVGKPECQRKGIQLSEMNIMGQYILRVKKNIHVILAMSPIGEAFRSRLRMFPSLINCCTIDWFSDWPEEALISVARGQLTEEDLGIESSLESLVQFFKLVHKSVEETSVKFLNELRRHIYVTPTSYLELLRCFKNLLVEKRSQLQVQKSRFSGGVERLIKAAAEVEQMKMELTKMKPELAEAQVQSEKMMEHIVVDKAEAEETQKHVAKDEAEAQEKADEVERLQSQAQSELDEALPLLEKALESVKLLKRDHIVEVKSFTAPSDGVIMTMEAVCLFFGIKPVKKNDPNKLGGKIDDYWEPAKNELLKNPKQLLEDLINYKRDGITEDLIERITPKVQNERFRPDVIRASSVACEAMCKWVHAMYNFYHVNKQVEPLRKQVAQLNAELEISRSKLREAKAKLKAVTDKIEALERDYESCIQRQEFLKEKINDCEIKLERAEKLIGGLGGEQVRWSREAEHLTERIIKLPGDCALSAGMVAYAGAFTGTYRQALEIRWRKSLEDHRVNLTKGVTMRATLGDPVQMQQWKVAGLPSDAVSIENGIIIEKARRWSLMIDPQNQANSFIKKLGKEHEEGIEFCKASDGNIIRNLGTAIMNGKWFLIENVGEELDPALEPVLLQQVIKEGAGFTIRIGDKNVEYNRSFRFFMTTTLPNPHYSPETCVKVTLLNFAITPEGLEEQMLATVVAKENPKLEETKSLLIAQNAKAQRNLKEIEDTILEQISSSEENILENQELINTLAASKQTSTNIMAKVEEAKQTEKEIDAARESYRPVAFRASLLFFCIVNLSNVDPMYQYSLQWFTRLFELGIDNAPNSGGLEERLTSLNEYFTYSLYQNVCRSLFEKHKLLFSFILTMKILEGYKQIDMNEWRYMLTGPQGTFSIPPNPTTWLNDNTWKSMYEEIQGLEKLEHFHGFERFFLTNIDLFRNMFDSLNAHEEPLPTEWESKLNEFERLLVIKAIRPDKVIPGIQTWVSAKLGRKFIIPPTFDLSIIYQDSGVTTPLICVLSAGSDPISAILRFAEEKGMTKKLNSCSLGQGQGEKARRFIDEAKGRGEWVLLQNCHLAASWMPSLERIVEEFDDSIHRDFRLWLTSMPAKEFPVSVLQNGIKMTIEPPQGLRSNLLLSYSTVDDKDLDDCNKIDAFKTLFFGFCFFHAIVQDRRKFGPIGWNIQYEFTNEDLGVTLKQLKIFLNQDTPLIPYKVLNILGAEVNYGGRVTDDKDVRLINTILRNYICPQIFDEGYKFSTSGKYFSPPPGKKDDYVKYIESLDLNPEPEAFGLHDNAEITTAQNETRKVLETILLMQPRTGSTGGKSREEIIRDIAKNLENSMPSKFALDDVAVKYPPDYEESMNTVLFQEVIKYQRLLVRMELTLAQVQKALVGRIVMSEELELIAKALYDNQVPESWSDVGFLSLKPLSAWFQELQERIKFMNDWIRKGTPDIFWISGFFFPQAFITGTLQNYARKHKIPIDHLSFHFDVLDNKNVEDIRSKPEDGCYIWGLWLEGARWDKIEHCLSWSFPKDLYTQMPIMHFIPKEHRKVPETGVYFCPVYKVLSRRGTLSTTGHSTNFVLFVELISKISQDIWIRAGVALFLSLRS